MKLIHAFVLLSCFTLRSTIDLKAQAVAAPTNDPARICQEMGHGFNLGNALEVPKGEDWGVTLKEGYFDAIEKAGFTLVRIPVSWPAHSLEQAPYTIEPEFFKQVDWAVDQAKAHHLHAIIDFHHFNPINKDPAAQEGRFLGLWKQVAEHYKNEPPEVYFELLNEPADKLDAAKWNGLLAKALAVVRASNPTRLVVVGGVHWNGIKDLQDLVLPDDDWNLIVTFHYYNPLKFTHQGASWMEGSGPWLGTKWLGTDAEKQKVDQDFDKAAAWGKEHQRPIYLGEFGSYEKADMDSRVRWTRYVVHSAEAHGFAWTYWEFCSGFGAYDPLFDQWRKPLLDALKGDAVP